MKHNMPLYRRVVTPEIEQKLQMIKTDYGVTYADIICSGVKNPDSSIGCYAGCPDSYQKFAPLFNGIIKEYHDYDITKSIHTRDFNASQFDTINLYPTSDIVISTRIRVSRNLEGFAFPPTISKRERSKIESHIIKALLSLKCDLSGNYYSLASLPEKRQKQLIKEHILFKNGDKFQISAGINRDWPANRGIYYSVDKSFIVWVNEEDHLRIISMQSRGNIQQAFDKLLRAVTFLESKLTFVYTKKLGYLSSCPTNLGTGMRASVHIKLPAIIQRHNLKKIANELGLEVRGIDGEHTNSYNGIYDISNKKRLGISENEIISTLIDGIQTLICMELKKN